MQRILSLLFLLLLPSGTVLAAPQRAVEIGGVARASGAILRLASEGVFQVTDAIEFPSPSGPLTVSFPNVAQGDYFGQISPDGESWSDATGLLAHSAAGTLSFPHDPGPVVTVFYRLSRIIETCADVTIRNTGNMALTGIAANLTGGGFSLDTSGMATSLNPGETTTLTVCVTATDQNEHLATLLMTGNATPFTLALIGDNDPGPITVVAPAPAIAVFTNRPAFETTIGGRVTEDFAENSPLLPVTTAHGGAIAGGKWNDIAREPEPSTVWAIPDGTTGWGGTWDLTVAGTGGGLAFDLDFGDGNIVTVPAHLSAGSAAGVFLGFTADQPFFAVRVRQFDSVGNTLQETHAFDDMTFQVNAGGEIAVHDGPTTGSAPLSDAQAAVLDIGTVARSATVTRTFTVANASAEPLRVFRLSAGGPFQIANAPALPATLATGESLNFDVAFSSAAGGVFDQAVKVLSSDADETPFDFTVRANVPVEAEITVTNTQNNADVADGQATVIQIQPNPFGGGSSVSVLVANTGLDPLNVSAVSLPAGFGYTFGGGLLAPRTLAPGASLPFIVTSTGPTPGVYEGLVTLTTNDADEGEFTFPIRALYDMPEIEVLQNFSLSLASGATVDIGSTPLGQLKQVGFVVRNLHAGTLTVTGVTLPPGYTLGDFAPSFPFSLGRNQVSEIPVRLNAQTPGTFAGMMQIANNDAEEGPFLIQLTGTVSPESITFFGFSNFINEGGSVNAFGFGIGPVAYEWDLDHDGQFDDATGDTVSLPDSDGPDTFPASVRMTDSLTTIIRTATVPVNNNPPFIDAPFTESVVAGAPLVLDVTAHDSPADVAAGMAWRIDWSDGEESTTPAGHPSATVFSHAFTRLGLAEITLEATDKDDATGSAFRSVWVHSAVIGVFDGPDTVGLELRDGQDSLSFQTFAGGTQDRALTILNRSASAANVGPASLPEGYSLVAPPAFPAAIAPGATLTLTLRFAPPSGGSFTGTLALTTSDPAMPAFDIALSGFADAPDIAVSEFSGERFDFASDTQSFSVFPGTQPFNGVSLNIQSSNSNAPLVIQSIELPSGFQLASPPAFPLDFTSPSSRDFRVQCSATSPGFYKGWVRVVSNDPNESPFRFFVTSRVGDVADLRVSAATTDLQSAVGLILKGQNEPLAFPLKLRFRNQGNQALVVSAITLPAGFTFSSPPTLPTTLTPSGSTTLPEILFTATDPGTYSGEVVITSTDPDENPFHFAISASVSGTDPSAPELTTFTLTPATPTTGVTFSAAITGPPNATVVLEGTTDLGQLDDWSELTRITLDAAGTGTISPSAVLNTSGVARFFVRLRLGP